MAGWGVVVPVKRLALAKTRLRPYDDGDRTALALAMALDVVAACLACPDVERVVVVSGDPGVRRALDTAGARLAVVDDGLTDGLNAALALGEGELVAGGTVRVAALAGDLPALRPAALSAALAQVAAGARGVAADAPGTGTTLLAASGVPLAPAYGAGSCAAHLASGAVALDAAAGLRLDVDTPADLARALELGVGPRTAAVAAGLVRVP